VTPAALLRTVIDPGLAFMASVIGPAAWIASNEARLWLLTIAGQEGLFRYRRQLGGGPARSYWEFEHGGGVAGVLAHPIAGPMARAVCAALDIPGDSATVFEAMAWNDHLAVTMARLNLWIARGALPGMLEQAAGWIYYLNQWGPGKPGPDRWPGNYQAATAAISETAPVM
jgi:hypothetical protein